MRRAGGDASQLPSQSLDDTAGSRNYAQNEGLHASVRVQFCRLRVSYDERIRIRDTCARYHKANKIIPTEQSQNSGCSSKMFVMRVLGEARSANWSNMLRERECAHGFLLPETVVGTSSMLRVVSVFTVLVEGVK